MSAKIHVVGSASQLGRSMKLIRPDFHYISRAQLDLVNLDSIPKFFREKVPVIINFASFTAVDDAETNRDEAHTINTLAVGELAKCCDILIHISTDYVFSGRAGDAYVESDETSPINYYGETKLLGEIEALKNNKNAMVVRTSWLYSEFNKNFVKRIIELAQTRDSLRVVDDQIGTPTYSGDLVDVVAKMAEQPRGLTGQVYHYSNIGECSWYGFTKEIFRLMNISTPVTAITSKEFPSPATRPTNSILDKSKIKKAMNIEIPTWQESLAKFLKNYTIS